MHDKHICLLFIIAAGTSCLAYSYERTDLPFSSKPLPLRTSSTLAEFVTHAALRTLGNSAPFDVLQARGGLQAVSIPGSAARLVNLPSDGDTGVARARAIRRATFSSALNDDTPALAQTYHTDDQSNDDINKHTIDSLSAEDTVSNSGLDILAVNDILMLQNQPSRRATFDAPALPPIRVRIVEKPSMQPVASYFTINNRSTCVPPLLSTTTSPSHGRNIISPHATLHKVSSLQVDCGKASSLAESPMSIRTPNSSHLRVPVLNFSVLQVPEKNHNKKSHVRRATFTASSGRTVQLPLFNPMAVNRMNHQNADLHSLTTDSNLLSVALSGPPLPLNMFANTGVGLCMSTLTPTSTVVVKSPSRLDRSVNTNVQQNQDLISKTSNSTNVPSAMVAQPALYSFEGLPRTRAVRRVTISSAGTGVQLTPELAVLRRHQHQLALNFES